MGKFVYSNIDKITSYFKLFTFKEMQIYFKYNSLYTFTIPLRILFKGLLMRNITKLHTNIIVKYETFVKLETQKRDVWIKMQRKLRYKIKVQELQKRNLLMISYGLSLIHHNPDVNFREDIFTHITLVMGLIITIFSFLF